MEPELVDLSSSILDQHPDLRQMNVKMTAGVLCKFNVYTHLHTALFLCPSICLSRVVCFCEDVSMSALCCLNVCFLPLCSYSRMRSRADSLLPHTNVHVACSHLILDLDGMA